LFNWSPHPSHTSSLSSLSGHLVPQYQGSPTGGIKSALGLSYGVAGDSSVHSSLPHGSTFIATSSSPGLGSHLTKDRGVSSEFNDEYNSDDDGDDSKPPASKKRNRVETEGGKESAVDMAKIKNRENARKFRLKKKQFIADLEGRVRQLEEENHFYKNLVATNGIRADQMVASTHTAAGPSSKHLNSTALVPAVPMNFPDADDLTFSMLNDLDFGPDSIPSDSLFFISYLSKCQFGFVVTNPQLPDNPVIFCDKGFEKVCGYERNEIIGRNCRFLQGNDERLLDSVSKQVKVEIKATIDNKSAGMFCMRNFRKDGTPYWALILLSTMDSNGRTMMHIGTVFVINDDLAARIHRS
jgi:PAS domain-containing protein